MSNPLLEPSRVKYGAVPFDLIKIEHFVPALDVAIAGAKIAVSKISGSTQPADFGNTIVALETATAAVYDIAYVFSNLRSAHGDAAMHALAKEVMPKLIKLESDINLDAALFQRVQAVQQNLPSTLTTEEKTLVDRTYRSFRRNGAMLDENGKQRLRAIDEELSTLSPQFSENVLKATNNFTLLITDRAELSGLPDSAIEAAAQAAQEKGHANAWLVTLQATKETRSG